jgi:hypothetical protein
VNRREELCKILIANPDTKLIPILIAAVPMGQGLPKETHVDAATEKPAALKLYAKKCELLSNTESTKPRPVRVIGLLATNWLT